MEGLNPARCHLAIFVEDSHCQALIFIFPEFGTSWLGWKCARHEVPKDLDGSLRLSLHHSSLNVGMARNGVVAGKQQGLARHFTQAPAAGDGRRQGWREGIWESRKSGESGNNPAGSEPSAPAAPVQRDFAKQLRRRRGWLLQSLLGICGRILEDPNAVLLVGARGQQQSRCTTCR